VWSADGHVRVTVRTPVGQRVCFAVDGHRLIQRSVRQEVGWQADLDLLATAIAATIDLRLLRARLCHGTHSVVQGIPRVACRAYASRTASRISSGGSSARGLIAESTMHRICVISVLTTE